MMTFFVIANWAQGKGLSGGDRIFIELFKRWLAQKKVIARFFVSEEAVAMANRSGLTMGDVQLWSRAWYKKLGMLGNGLVRTVGGTLRALFMPLGGARDCYVYSTSDFLPDALPAFFMKLRRPQMQWIAGFYLSAPNPFSTYSPYRGFFGRFKNFIYYLTQQPAYWLIRSFADFVCLTSEPDLRRFITKKRGIERMLIIKGGVDLSEARLHLEKGNDVPVRNRLYDACFLGRFHPQKGALELVDIWEDVVKRKQAAKLAMIGDGPLEEAVRRRIYKKGLTENIVLKGFIDGPEKLEIFKQSKIMAHPPIYDSGGMAPIEAMAWGLPGVSFDLESLRTYFPKGMMKVECFDKARFAEAIIALLSDENLYRKLSDEAISLAGEWDWDKRAQDVLCRIKNR